MKRKFIIIFLSAVIACIVGGMAACSDNTAPHEHTWNSGEITTQATCGSVGVKTYTCAGCGETKTEAVPQTAHPHSEEWLHNDTEHWQATTCEHTTERASVGAHVWDNGQTVRVADCINTGLVKYTCVCGMTKTQTVDKTGHSFAEIWSFDENKHWHVCTNEGCTEIGGEAVHTYGSWTEVGQLVKTCAVCSYELAAPSIGASGNETIKVGGGETVGLTLFTRGNGYYTVQCTTTVSVTFTCCYSEWDFGTKQNVRYEKVFTVTPENNTFTLKLSERSVAYITVASDSQEVVEGTVKVSYSDTAPSHTHSFSTEWSNDETYHWHACTGDGCEEEQNTAMHQFEGDICTDCGYQRSNEQIPSEANI